MATVEEIGALIVAIRTDTAQFRAETEGARKGLERVGQHAVLSARSLARFGAIAAEQVVPGLQGSRVAIESVVVALSNARGAFVAMLLPVAKVAAVFAGGFFLGQAIRNFIELRQEGHGLVESLKLAVGITKSYQDSVKEAADEQKKFSAAQAANRSVIADLDKGLATLTDDYRKLAELAELERRTRINTLPLAEREAQQRKSSLITEIELMTKRAEKEAEIQTAREKQQEKGQSAATALKISPSSLIFGLKELETFQKNVDDLGNEILRLAAKGVPARDLFTEIAEGQAKVDAGLAELKLKFGGVPEVFNRIADAERSIGGGEFRRGIDEQVKGMQKLKEGSAQVTDETGTVIVTLGKAKQGFGETAEAAKKFTETLQPLPVTFAGLDSGFVAVTGRLRALAEAFNFARQQAILFETVVGSGGEVAVPAPGNF